MRFNKISFQLHLQIAIMALLFTLAGYYCIFDGHSFTKLLGIYGFPTAVLISFSMDCEKINQNKKDKE